MSLLNFLTGQQEQKSTDIFSSVLGNSFKNLNTSTQTSTLPVKSQKPVISEPIGNWTKKTTAVVPTEIKSTVPEQTKIVNTEPVNNVFTSVVNNKQSNFNTTQNSKLSNNILSFLTNQVVDIGLKPFALAPMNVLDVVSRTTSKISPNGAVANFLNDSLEYLKKDYTKQFRVEPTLAPTAFSGSIQKTLKEDPNTSALKLLIPAIGASIIPTLDAIPLLPEGAAGKTLFKKIAGSVDKEFISKVVSKQFKNLDAKILEKVSDDLVNVNTVEGVESYFKQLGDDAIKVKNEFKNIIDNAKVEDSVIQEGKDMFLHNINKMNIPEAAKNKLIKDIIPIKESVENIIGKTMTFQDVANKASEISDTLVNTVGREETLEFAAKANNTKDLIATIASKGAMTSDDISKLYDAFAALDTYAADAGRKLNALKYGGEPTQNKIIDTLFKKINELGITKEQMLAKAKLYDLTTIEGQQQLYREFVKPKAEAWLDTLRMNSMLSSPATHAANILSNFEGTGLLAPIRILIEGGVDATRNLFTKTGRTRFSGEAMPYLKGYYNPTTIKEAWGQATDIMRGIQDIQNIDIRDIPKADPKTLLGKVEKVLSIPMRMLESMDIFFSQLTSMGEIGRLKYREGLGVNLSRRATTMAKEKAEKELFRSKIVNDTEGTIAHAVGTLASKLQSLQYSDNTLLRIMSKFTMPFVRTPVNILKSGIEHSPIFGIPNLIRASDKTEAVSKILLGSGITLAGLNKALNGDITFSYPTDKSQKDNMKALGIPEYSIKIGNNWYSYQKLHPAIAFNLATLGAFAQGMSENRYSDNKISDIASAIGAGSLKFLANQSYLKSWGEFMNAMNGDEFAWQRFLSNYPQQVIPFRALSSWVNRMVLENQKELKTDSNFFKKQLELIMLQVPGLSSKLDDKLDQNGLPIKNPDRIRPDNLTGIMTAIGQRTVPTTDEITGQFKTYNDARLFKKYMADKTKDNKKMIDYTVSMINQSSNKEVKKQIITTFAIEHPELINKLTDKITNTNRKLTSEENIIDSMPIKDGTRSAYILSKIKQLKTPEEKKQYITNLYTKKILTKETISLMNSLLRLEGQIQPILSE